MLHHGEHVATAQRPPTRIDHRPISDAADAGAVRSDIPPGELTLYCLHALSAAGSLPAGRPVHRLVQTTTFRPAG